MKLNLGCGTRKWPGFVNIDHRMDVRPDRQDDAFLLATFEPNSVDEVVASHLLEHACFDRTVTALKRWHEVLKPGGILWLAVPNFQLVLGQHLANLRAGKITWEYFNSRIFGNAGVAHVMYGNDKLKEIDGIYRYELAFHRAVFTPAMLIKLCLEAGFTNVISVARIPYKSKHSHECCIKARKDRL